MEDGAGLRNRLIENIKECFNRGAITRSEMKLIRNVFAYMDTDAKDIMTHRKSIIALDGKMLLDEAIALMLEESYSRFPVYDEDIDSITGIIHLRDAFKTYMDPKMRNIPIGTLGDSILPVALIPETKSIDKLFQMMQADKCHMAVVIDEYGQTAGIVTMEDIIEELVGNIQDEYDEEEEMIERKAEGVWVVDGLTPLDDLEEVLGIHFEEEDYDTLNGFLVDAIDRIPSEEEQPEVNFGGYIFEILSVDNNMIQKVKIIRDDRA